MTYLASLLAPSLPVPPSPVPPNSYLARLQTTPNLTLFAPSDAAWAKLPQIERVYLESGFAEEDITLLVRLHVSVVNGSVAWRDSFGSKGRGEVEMVGGGKVWVEVGKDGAMQVGLEEDRKEEEDGKERHGIAVVEPDVYAENGASHPLPALSSV